LIFQLENKNIHASDSGQGIDINKDTIVFYMEVVSHTLFGR